MHKDLERYCTRWEFFQLAQGKLPCEHHAIHPERLHKPRSLRRCHRHLRRGMNRQLWRNRARQPHQSDILHNQRIDPGPIAAPQFLSGIIELPGE